MQFTLITLFPDILSSFLTTSILKRAREKGTVTFHSINIRDFSTDAYKTVDDHPYGGGAGMILRVDLLDQAIQTAKALYPDTHTRQVVVLLDPRGETYQQKKAQELANNFDHIILVCGHYEGVDERIRDLVDQTISIGDYIVTGGEIAALAIIDSVTRLLPGVIHPVGPVKESFSEQLLEYPQYTRPPDYKGVGVPEILLSGNHKAIEEWRAEEAQRITKIHRPDLVGKK